MEQSKKKKTIIILIVISILIYASAYLVAILQWASSYVSSYDYNSLFAVASIPSIIINIIPIIWFVYIIVFLIKKKKSKSFKIWYLVLVFIMVALSAMSFIYFISLVNMKHINYQDSYNTYHIYKIGNRIELAYDDSKFVQCLIDPCQFTVSRNTIKFSSKNMKSINKFIDGLFKNTKSNYLELSDPKLSDEGLRIIKSIINNDEGYIKDSTLKELSFTLRSHKIKCPTVLLKVYTDKTYEYVNGDKILVGSFPYSMAEIILKVYNYDSGNGDVYEIKTKDNISTTIYDNNGKLKEMLSLSNINLDVCAQTVITN